MPDKWIDFLTTNPLPSLLSWGDPAKNECFINWYYMAVSADPNYMITMTVELNDFGFVARDNGFFQTSMYVPVQHEPARLSSGLRRTECQRRSKVG